MFHSLMPSAISSIFTYLGAVSLLRTSENPCAISKINARLYNWIIIQSNLSRCFLNVHSFVVAVVVVDDVLNGITITTLIERVSK